MFAPRFGAGNLDRDEVMPIETELFYKFDKCEVPFSRNARRFASLSSKESIDGFSSLARNKTRARQGSVRSSGFLLKKGSLRQAQALLNGQQEKFHNLCNPEFPFRQLSSCLLVATGCR